MNLLVPPRSDFMETQPWSAAQRVGFRLLFAYLVLYFFPLPSGMSGPKWASGMMDELWQRLVPWFGRTFLGLSITTFTNGSGDTTYDYVRVLCMGLLAIVAAVVWSLLDRRSSYRTLHAWSRIWLRYALAMTMLTYGVVKVIKLQFPTPGPGVLTQTYGESSPMRLLWTFMGYSTAYTFFVGAAELLAALLLFFRRTTTLGALVAAAVMANVAMLNLCYDVPVKLGSLHLLLLAGVVLAPDARRVADLLLFNRPTTARDLGPAWPGRWMRAAKLLKIVVVGGALIYNFQSAIDAKQSRDTQDVSQFPLMNRGFRWINEFPYNR
jgi:hypothetical protein